MNSERGKEFKRVHDQIRDRIDFDPRVQEFDDNYVESTETVQLSDAFGACVTFRVGSQRAREFSLRPLMERGTR